MSMRRLGISVRKAMALGLFALLVLGQTAAAAAFYRCQGVTRTSCCCPASEKPAEKPAISRAKCCDVEVVRVEPSGAPIEVQLVAFAAPAPAPLLETLAAPVVVERPAAALSGPHLPHAPPLILAKHSLLV